MLTPEYRYRAFLTKIVDGDTIYARVDLGFDTYRVMEIRLYGIDTPEKRGPTKDAGLAAKKYVEDWFLTEAPDGLFILESIKDKTEKFGRFLGIIHSYDAVLNDALVASGHAVPYTP